MNWKKGFERLTLVLSFLAGPLVFSLCYMAWGVGVGFEHVEFFVMLLAFEVNGFFAVWIIYLVVRWIVKGFRENEQKDEQKQSINQDGPAA